MPATPPAISFAAKPTLTGDLVVLRPPIAADIEPTMALLANPETVRLTGTQRGVSADEVRRHQADTAGRTDRLELTVVERATGEYAGEAVLTDLDVENLSCGFRIALIDGVATGRGLGTEASQLLIGYAFDTIGLHRVNLEVFAFNPRARRVYEKVGFVYEGTKRQALRWHGEWVDTHVMAMLADDWSARRAWSAAARRGGYPGR